MAIIAVGGISEPEDALRYIDNGANVVQATTIFFSDPYFAAKVRGVMDRRWPSPEAKLRQIKDGALKNWSRAWDELKQHYAPDKLASAAHRCWDAYEKQLQPGRVAAARALSGPPGIEEFRVAILNSYNNPGIQIPPFTK